VQLSGCLYIYRVQSVGAVDGEDSDFAFFLIVDSHLKPPCLYLLVTFNAQVYGELIAESKHYLPSGECFSIWRLFYLKGFLLCADFNRSGM
jgi:hypothetical protein